MAKKKRGKKLQVHLTGWWRRAFLNRKYKDELFRRVFHDKKDLLELYNAVNHTDYGDPDELEITTLGNVIYMSMKNDLSFIIGCIMNLYEHQSTFNPNMPVRGLLYFARLYEAYINKNKLDIYGRTLIRLPMPQYLVFYNGREDQPDEVELRLSDAFALAGKAGVFVEKQEPVLECRVRMLNINLGHNQGLMQGCHRLWEYAVFVGEVNKNLDKGYPLERAVNRAIDDCICQDILKDILTQSRSEVLNMLLTEFDAKRHWQNTYEEGLRAGRAEGMKAGHAKGIEQGQKQILCLYQKLLEENRQEDLERVSRDGAYREELLKEYGLHLTESDKRKE